MRALLDTHVLLWALAEPARLPEDFRILIEDRGNEVLFSAASIWEIAIKASLGRRDFNVNPGEVAQAAIDSGFMELPVRSSAAARVMDLAMRHRDPFDRLSVAQAIDEPAILYTADHQLEPYSELVKILEV